MVILNGHQNHAVLHHYWRGHALLGGEMWKVASTNSLHAQDGGDSITTKISKRITALRSARSFVNWHRLCATSTCSGR
jgi:hypothetical protein